MWDLWASCSLWPAEVPADQYNQMDLVLRWFGLSTEEKHHAGGADQECSSWLVTFRTVVAGRLVNLSVQLLQRHGHQRKDTRVHLCVCVPLHISLNHLGALLQWLDCILTKRTEQNQKNKKMNMTWLVCDTDLTEHRKINVCTSATLPPAEVKNGTAMEEFHIQVENKRRHPMLASPPPTPLAGNSQVKHTDMYYTGSFSHYTLYTSLGNRKRKLVVVFFFHWFVWEHPHWNRAQQIHDSRLLVFFPPQKKNFFLVFRTMTVLNIQSRPNALVSVCPFL